MVIQLKSKGKGNKWHFYNLFLLFIKLHLKQYIFPFKIKTTLGIPLKIHIACSITSQWWNTYHIGNPDYSN